MMMRGGNGWRLSLPPTHTPETHTQQHTLTPITTPITTRQQQHNSHFHKLPGGLVDGVSLPVGMACELALGCVLNLVVLHSMSRPDDPLHSKALPLVATVGLIVAGSGFSGPGLNPAMTTSYFLHYRDAKGRAAADHALLYWLAPVAGAALGGLVWRRLRGPGVGAPKRARKTRTA